MRRLLSFAFVILALLSAQAADEPKPNTLTSKAVADGWLLLFDGATTFGWKTDGTAKVANGALTVSGARECRLETTTMFGPSEIRFEYFLSGAEPKEVHFLLGGKHPLLLRKLEKWYEGSITISSSSFQAGFGESGSEISAAIGAKDFKGPVTPRVFGFVVPADTTLALRNVKLKPLELKPVFNGKDLAGWKEHPNKKSKFTVEDGTIHIQDGPGDLQTEAAWGDFALQIECRTNGKNLNSGVFFRCRPGEYQNGYEAQIHNGFGPEKDYTIETYDPETGKAIEARKEKFAAMDYGTGAIYRRMPARKQLAKDNDWFTMTVIAQGRHLATWVNGVQTVDWTDTRKPSDNARTGYRAEKGHISLQGHDPTTDLNFRNIRIGELANGEDKK